MNIAIDVSPLETGHKVRGTGIYLHLLKKALLRNYKEISFSFFTRKTDIPLNTDIVHYPYFEPFFISLPLFSKHRTIVTVHDLTTLVFPEHFPAGLKGKFKWLYQKTALKHADAIITDSESSKKDIMTIVGIPEERIHVIYLAADDVFRILTKDEINRIRKKYTLPEKFILYVGDATWNKNLPRILKAVKSSQHQLIIVGKVFEQKNIDEKNGWNADLLEVRKLVKDVSNIRILGFLPTEDLVGVYNAATLLVMPSLYEGFGLPILESMQSGCPVITSNTGSLPEVAGDAAIYVDPLSVDSIEKSINEIMKNENLQTELSVKGKKHAKKFSWDLTAKKTVRVYQEIINRHNK